MSSYSPPEHARDEPFQNRHVVIEKAAMGRKILRSEWIHARGVSPYQADSPLVEIIHQGGTQRGKVLVNRFGSGALPVAIKSRASLGGAGQQRGYHDAAGGQTGVTRITSQGPR